MTEAKTFEIRVSDRVKHLPAYLFAKLNRAKRERRRQGHDVIDLGMGNPNDPTPKRIVDKLCEAVQDPRNHRYSEAAGLFNLRREVARRYASRHEVELDPESEILSVIGSKEGFSHMCLALLQEGDSVIVPRPAFPIHVYGPGLAGAEPLAIPLRDEEQLLKSIVAVTETAKPRPKMLVLNFPHNPTAATVEPAFFEEVVAIAKKYGLIVIHDFAYAEIAFDGYKPPSFMRTPGAKDVGVEFTTMSKAFNMAGWRIGYCVGNRKALDALSRVKGYYDYGIFQPVQVAAIIAMRHCEDDAERQAKTYEKRRDVLCAGLERIGWPTPKPRATMFVWVPIPEQLKSLGSVDLAFKILDEANVAVAPGKAFGDEGEGWLRLALVENELRLKQAVRQIGRAFKLG